MAKTILLIDDSALLLRTIKGMLKGYDVKMAKTGSEAVEIIEKKRPDLIFLDYDMPVIDGKMTFKMIRGTDNGKDIPIVFLTGVKDKPHIEAVLELKPAGYILKPAEQEKILSTVHGILGEEL